MEKYKIDYSFGARIDLINIAAYIQNELKSPHAADNTVNAIIKAVSDLDFMPQRYAVLPEDLLEREDVRRMQVRNYFVYFSVDEDEKRVNILDVLYVGREQREQLGAGEE